MPKKPEPVKPIEIALLPTERARLLQEVDSLFETWTTVEELHSAIRDVVKAHGYVPGAVEQEAIGAVPWLVTTDRGLVRVAP
jgi:hypothetical protein